MAELIVDDEDLVVHLTLGEKLWGFHGDIRVRLSSIVSAAPDPKPWLGLRGWRMAGISLAGHAVLGTRRHGDGYDFCILHRDRPAVRVDVASGRFSRLVICVPEGGDPEAEAARIAAAAGIAPSAGQLAPRLASGASAERRDEPHPVHGLDDPVPDIPLGEVLAELMEVVQVRRG
jgi:hypothetical protein